MANPETPNFSKLPVILHPERGCPFTEDASTEQWLAELLHRSGGARDMRWVAQNHPERASLLLGPMVGAHLDLILDLSQRIDKLERLILAHVPGYRA